ncbi:MAG: hypothetical protein ACOX5X_04050 [Acholeplasmataceae bacterium]|jgi:uncharacterized membrane protein YczE
MKLDKKFWINFAIYLFGLILVGLGVQIIIYTDLGAAPLDAFTYYLARIYLQLFKSGDLSSHKTVIGAASFLFGTLTTIILFAITRNKKLIFTWLNILLISGIISAWGELFNNFSSEGVLMILRILILIAAIIILAFGVFLVLLTEFPAGPPEEIMKLINGKVNNLLVSKLITEGMYLVLALIAMTISKVVIDKSMMEFTQVGAFTIVTLVLTALLISLFDKVFRKMTSKKGEIKNE